MQRCAVSLRHLNFLSVLSIGVTVIANEEVAGSSFIPHQMIAYLKRVF